MKKVFFFFVFIFEIIFSASIYHASASSLYLQPRVGYQSARIFQGGQASTYLGISYGAAAYYKLPSFGDDDFYDEKIKIALAPVVSFHTGKFLNTANNSTQQETLSDQTISAGLKLYIGSVFIQGHYSVINLKDVATGNKVLTIEDSSAGYGAAVGIEIPITNGFNVELSGEINSVNFKPKMGGFSSPSTQHLKFGGFLGLSVFLPSNEGKNTLREIPDRRATKSR